MQRKKMLKFADWLRTQPNTIAVPEGACSTRTDPAFDWHDANKCIATYAKAWEDKLPIGTFSVGEEALQKTFHMPYAMAISLYTGGGEWTSKGRAQLKHAKLAKIADVIAGIAKGATVYGAMVDVFGDRVLHPPE